MLLYYFYDGTRRGFYTGDIYDRVKDLPSVHRYMFRGPGARYLFIIIFCFSISVFFLLYTHSPLLDPRVPGYRTGAFSFLYRIPGPSVNRG